MRYIRFAVVIGVLVICAINPPTAAADCPGIMCGGVCNVQGYDFCIYVMSGDPTIGCRDIDGKGCASMHSIICCPRDPAA